MNWSLLVTGVVLGSAITSALIWFQGRAGNGPSVDFASVAQSVVITALLAGAVRTALDFAAGAGFSMAGTLFGAGWMAGGLLAGWLLTGPMRR